MQLYSKMKEKFHQDYQMYKAAEGFGWLGSLHDWLLTVFRVLNSVVDSDLGIYEVEKHINTCVTFSYLLAYEYLLWKTFEGIDTFPKPIVKGQIH